MDQLPLDLVASARAKIASGKAPNRAERTALNRAEKEAEDKLRFEHYATIPKKHWLTLAGRQTSTVHDVADRYGFQMLRGPSVDLGAFLPAFHEFLKKNKYKLAAEFKEDDPLMAVGGSSPALEQYRSEKAQMARMQRLEMEGELVPRAPVHQLLGRLAEKLRSAGEMLERDYDVEARRLIDDLLDECARETETTLGTDDGTEAEE